MVAAVNRMRSTHHLHNERLQQFKSDFLMYGRYNAESLEKIISTINSLHEKQTAVEHFFQEAIGKTQSEIE